jgi:site-specific recombinase XerD
MTAYAAGLRVSELVNLKLADIDSKRMMIRVHHGKGRKDRYTILSKRLQKELRIYWKMYRPMHTDGKLHFYNLSKLLVFD